MHLATRHFSWTNLVIDSDLPPLSKYLCLYLATFMNSKQNLAWPSLARIEKETSLTKPTIIKYLDIAESGGFLVVERTDDFRTNNKYHAQMPEGVVKVIDHPLVKDIYQGSKGDLPGVVKDINTNKQVNRQVNKQKTKSLSGSPDSARILLKFLNDKTGRHYRETKGNLKFIKDRLKDYTEQELRTMIARKTREWQNDPEMNKYLRPATLFNPTKCDQYIGECV